MDEKPDSIEARATAAETNGSIAEALAIRERLLLVLQKIHGDPSAETDSQKVRIGELICLLVTQEQQGNIHSLLQTSSDYQRKRSMFSSAYGPEEAELEYGQRNHTSFVQHEAQRALENSSLFLRSKSRMAGDGVVTSILSLQGLLAFGERLLAPENTLASSQRDRRLRLVRCTLLTHLATVLYRQGRPRAALPLAQTAQVELLQLTPSGSSVEVASGYLTLCAVLSASNKHAEALRCAHAALDCTMAVEAAMAQNDPTFGTSSLRASTSQSTSRMLSATASPRADDQHPGAETTSNALTSDSMSVWDHDEQAGAALSRCAPGSYLGSLIAACYHNMGAEQEHMSLPELALRTYGIGFRVARKVHGESHPLVERMYDNYCQVFQSVNYRRFNPDGRRPGEKSTALTEAARAVRRLNFTYVSSSRHQEALAKEERRERALLTNCDDPLRLSMSLSKTQHLVTTKVRASRSRSALLRGSRASE